MKRIVICVLLLSGFFYTQAQTNKIVFSNSAIKLDGKLDEAIWKNIIPEGNFLNYIPNNGILANRQTEVKIFHNGENLYIGAVYHDTTSEVQIGSLKRDDIGNAGGNSDSFAVIILSLIHI